MKVSPAQILLLLAKKSRTPTAWITVSVLHFNILGIPHLRTKLLQELLEPLSLLWKMPQRE